jgi:hypothetical protein
MKQAGSSPTSPERQQSAEWFNNGVKRSVARFAGDSRAVVYAKRGDTVNLGLEGAGVFADEMRAYANPDVVMLQGGVGVNPTTGKRNVDREYYIWPERSVLVVNDLRAGTAHPIRLSSTIDQITIGESLRLPNSPGLPDDPKTMPISAVLTPADFIGPDGVSPNPHLAHTLPEDQFPRTDMWGGDGRLAPNPLVTAFPTLLEADATLRQQGL